MDDALTSLKMMKTMLFMDDEDPAMSTGSDEIADDSMMDSLRNIGVPLDDAKNFVRAINLRRGTHLRGNGPNREGDHHTVHCESKTRSAHPKAALAAKSERSSTFVEVYGGGSLCRDAETSRRNLNLKDLHALDIRTLKSDGTPLNFCRKADRIQAKHLIHRKKPEWLIGSPPCTAFSLWNRALNYKKMDPKEVLRRISEGRKHLSFVTSPYRDQLRRGKHVLHEHPQSAYSWQEAGIKSLAQDPQVHLVTGDQCMYGFVTPTGDINVAPARKATTFMNSSRQMADLLGTRCDKSHIHQPLVGGRCADAAFYPKKLIQTILQGIRNTKDVGIAMAENELERKQLICSVMDSAGSMQKDDALYKSKITKTNRGILNIVYDPSNFRSKYVDEYTGETLDPSLISAAMREELDDFNSKVWQIETKSNMQKKKDYVFVRSRWVLSNKGDSQTCEPGLSLAKLTKEGLTIAMMLSMHPHRP